MSSAADALAVIGMHGNAVVCAGCKGAGHRGLAADILAARFWDAATPETLGKHQASEKVGSCGRGAEG